MKCLFSKGFPVINIPWCHHEIQQFTLFIAYQVQFEAKEPPHGTLAACSEPLESLMDVDSLIATDTHGCRVNKAYTSTLSKKDLLDEDDERYDYLLLQFDKAVIGYQPRKQVTEMLADMINVEMFKAAIARAMEKDHDNHNLCIRHGRISVILTFTGLGTVLNGIFFHHTVKNFAKLICHKENIRNFVFGEHSDYCLDYFVIGHYKDTIIFAIYQIFNQLYFIELTLNYTYYLW